MQASHSTPSIDDIFLKPVRLNRKFQRKHILTETISFSEEGQGIGHCSR